jgi:hypothetical protein
MTGISVLLMLAIAAFLVFVNTWFSHRVQSLSVLIFGNGAAPMYLYALLMLPGTLIHELSHFFAAKLLGVRTGRISLRPRLSADGRRWILGQTQIVETDEVRGSLIGLAPLLVGSALLFCVVRWGLGVTALTTGTGNRNVDLAHLPGLRGAWPWLYLLLVIGNSMFPSPSDRRTWLPMGIYMGIMLSTTALGLGMTGALPRLLASPFVERMTLLLKNLIDALTLTFTCTLFVDLSVGGILWMAEILLGKLLGRSVVRR